MIHDLKNKITKPKPRINFGSSYRTMYTLYLVTIICQYIFYMYIVS